MDAIIWYTLGMLAGGAFILRYVADWPHRNQRRNHRHH